MTHSRINRFTLALIAAVLACAAWAPMAAHAGIPGDGPWKGRGWDLLEGEGSNLTSVWRWNRCGAPIRFQIYLGTAPKKMRGKLERLARAEAAEIATRTGLPFSYQGITKKSPSPGKPAPGTEIVIAFVAGNQAGGVVRGGPVWSARVNGWSNMYGEDHILTTLADARVFVDWKDTKKYSMKRGKDGLTVPNVLRRGLATAVGLERVHDRKQVMNYELSSKTPGSWGAGDLHALNLAGKSKWCEYPNYGPPPELT